MPTRLCNNPICPNPAAYRGRCAQHARARQQQVNNHRQHQRHIYNSRRWRNTRNRYLRDHPLCECDNPTCYEIATDVHHRLDLELGGDPWHPDNLQALAHACHAQITRARQATQTGSHP